MAISGTSCQWEDSNMCYCNCSFENRDRECTLGVNKIIPSSAKCHPDYNIPKGMDRYHSIHDNQNMLESDCSEAAPPVHFKGIRIISDNRKTNRNERRICKL